MLSDNTKMKYLPTRKRRADGSAGRNKSWNDTQKIEAVTTYLVLGSVKLTSAALKIPLATLKMWRQKEWWKDVENDLRTQEDLQLSARLKRIVNRSYDVIEDRMENGDFVYDQKTGQMRRKPVSMRDMHAVSKDLLVASQDLMDRHMEEKTVSVDTIEKKLADLAESFAKIAGSVNDKKPVEVTDVLFGTVEKPKEIDNAPEES